MSIDRSTRVADGQEWELGVAIPGRILPEEQWSEVEKARPLAAGVIGAKELATEGLAGGIVLDVGCGNGRFSLLSALARPGVSHAAVEGDEMPLRYLRRRAKQRGVRNLRLFVGDAVDLMQRIESGSAAEVHVYHPQPFHEPGHAAERLFRPGFQMDVYRALAVGGTLCVQTDSKPYAHYLRQSLPALFEVRELGEGDEWPDGLGRPRGRRELVAAEKGLKVWRFFGVKRALTEEAATARAGKLAEPAFKSDRKVTYFRRKGKDR